MTAATGSAAPPDPIAVRARAGGENFPVALRVLPRAARDRLLAVYDYCRFVDEVGDAYAGDRLALLDRIAAEVRELPASGALPAVAGLAPYDPPHEPLLRLVGGNRRDQQVSRYPTFADLRAYCALSADPVGALVLWAFGVDTRQRRSWSDDVCTALQVLEHLQDVGEDARAGRIYLPADELADEGCRDADLLAAAASPALRRVVAAEVARSRRLLASGVPLVRSLRGWARVAVAGYVAGGLATADAIAAARCDVLAQRCRPSRARTARHAVALLVGRGKPA